MHLNMVIFTLADHILSLLFVLSSYLQYFVNWTKKQISYLKWECSIFDLKNHLRTQSLIEQPFYISLYSSQVFLVHLYNPIAVVRSLFMIFKSSFQFVLILTPKSQSVFPHFSQMFLDDLLLFSSYGQLTLAPSVPQFPLMSLFDPKPYVPF